MSKMKKINLIYFFYKLIFSEFSPATTLIKINKLEKNDNYTSSIAFYVHKFKTYI